MLIVQRRIFQLRKEENYIAIYHFRYEPGNGRNRHFHTIRGRVDVEQMPYFCMYYNKQQECWSHSTQRGKEEVQAAMAANMPMRIVGYHIGEGCEEE